MKILIASDSFKEALSAREVCQSIAGGWRSMAPEDEIRLFPLADGGEGTAYLLTHYSGGALHEIEVTGPRGEKVQATFGLDPTGQHAFLDMASASGLELLEAEKRNPLHTSTRGTGQMIAHLLDRGVEHIFLGLGGSATHDLGTGMAEAIGFEFQDQNGKPVSPCGENLIRIHRILPPKRDLSRLHLTLLSDVSNPLLGPQGAARNYARQKGASEKEIEHLEAGTRHFSERLEAFAGRSFASLPGAGAAGGMGAGGIGFLGGRIQSGAELLLERSGLKNALPDADLLLGGEGRLDATSFSGKLLSSILTEAGNHQVPVIALCGQLALRSPEYNEYGLLAAFSICNGPMSLEEAMQKTSELLHDSSACLARLFHGS
jgi:glycerate kinase